ncbi:hypothetical protein HK405_002297 [Cladochytrium tenue]|nr:hypothetical protein HK405_002297 [Cladochytrium tenue]
MPELVRIAASSAASSAFPESVTAAASTAADHLDRVRDGAAHALPPSRSGPVPAAAAGAGDLSSEASATPPPPPPPRSTPVASASPGCHHIKPAASPDFVDPASRRPPPAPYLLRPAAATESPYSHSISRVLSPAAHSAVSTAFSATSAPTPPPEVEERRLLRLFFTLSHSLSFIHRPSFLRSYPHAIDPFLCLELGLNVDPDELPLVIQNSMSWIEKETRRRCWWISVLADFDLSFFAGRTSHAWDIKSSVQPYCDSDAWQSLDASTPPPGLVHDVPLLFRLRLRALLARLLDSHPNDGSGRSDIDSRYRPQPVAAFGPLDVVAELDMLEAGLPPALRLRLDEDWVFAAVHDRRTTGCWTALELFNKARYATVLALSPRTIALVAALACRITCAPSDDGGRAAVRSVLTTVSQNDAAGFWAAADAAVALASVAALVRRANVTLSFFPLGQLQYATVAALMLTGLLDLLRLAPALLPAAVDLGLVSPRRTPYLYCIPAHLHEATHDDDDDSYGTAPTPPHDTHFFPTSRPPLTPPPVQPHASPPFTRAPLRALLRESRAFVDAYCPFWPVATWQASLFRSILDDSPSPARVRAAAADLALIPMFTEPSAAAAPPDRGGNGPLLAECNPPTSLPFDKKTLSGGAFMRLSSAAIVLSALTRSVAVAVVPIESSPAVAGRYGNSGPPPPPRPPPPAVPSLEMPMLGGGRFGRDATDGTTSPALRRQQQHQQEQYASDDAAVRWDDIMAFLDAANPSRTVS